jgi:hypothetical protein
MRPRWERRTEQVEQPPSSFLLALTRSGGRAGVGGTRIVEDCWRQVEVGGRSRVGVGRNGSADGLEREMSLGEERVVGDDASMMAEALLL